MREFKFSIIIATYNSDLWISQTIDSLINQSLDFEKNVEVIIVNDGSIDQTEYICQKYKAQYPKNIKYISKEENEGPAASRNVGLKYASGKYVNFLDSDDYLSKNALKEIDNFFKQHPGEADIVSIPIYYFGEKKGGHSLNYKYKKSQVIDLIENPSFIQLSSSSAFIKREAIGNIEFNPELITSEDVVFINEILLKKPKLGLCKKAKYFYRKREEKSSIIDNSSFKKEYFNQRVTHYFKYLIDESVKRYFSIPQFIQYTLMYDLQWIFSIKSVNNILSKSEIIELRRNLYSLLQFIDDDIIYNQKDINNRLKANMLFFKYNNFKNNPKLSEEYAKIYENIVKRLKLNTLYIDIFEIKNNELYIMASLNSTFKDIEVNMTVNGEDIKTARLNFPQRDQYSLSYKYAYNYTFEANIPLNQREKFELEFYINKTKFNKLFIDFSRPCNFSKVAGYAKTKDYLSIAKKDKIIIKKKNNLKWAGREIKTLFKMIKDHKKGFKTGIPLRIGYLLIYPFLRNRRIWLFMDLPAIADDNSRHLFKYASDKDEDIKKYFVLTKNSVNWKEMNEIGNVLSYKSIKHRFLALFAENIITSHPDNSIIYPFWGNYPHFAGLLKSNTVFLQHGITKDNISSWLNKYDKNLAFFLTASPEEYTSIFKYPYNYKKEEVRLLGFPRFDNLKNEEDKRQILIMPSWRRYLKFKSNEIVLDSQYFKRFNSLINNKKLINEAEKYNYEIIFKPHPNVYDFIDLFEKNRYVEIDDGKTKYQTLFNNGSLLITDYSSVAFDFAYLYKPVLYYHYSDDYHFNLNEGYFNYETMGFGEITRNEDELVDLIIEYMANNCKMKEKYEKNVKNFFLFTDKHNCKRVYEAIKELDTQN